MKRVSAWLEERGAGIGGLRGFLTKPVPRNVGWVHTLGSLLMVYLLFQMLTGILLSLYYSPSPDHAYRSVRYIHDELTLGAFLLKLHRFGAGFVMVTAFLHCARSYFLGAYKSPRELLWVTGLLLGALLTLFAFTGQLLPYDQRGYWATVVGVEIAAGAPGLGESVRQFLTGGYETIGATTLSRFFILHVCVLPLAFLGLMGFHLKVLQKVGSAGPLEGSPEPHRSFYPGQVVKDTLVAAGGSLLLFALAGVLTLVDTGPADPAVGNFTPRPEWYFLAHYEVLKVLPGSAQVLGTFVLPNLMLGFLLLLPFLDRKPERALGKRRLVVGFGAASCLLLVVLTGLGIASEPETAQAEERADPVAWGRELFTTKECANCHGGDASGAKAGPSLVGVSRRLKTDYLPAWIRNPAAFKPDTQMPAFDGSEEELRAVIAFLLEPR